MSRIRVGDEVVVISGNDKSKRGKVTRVLSQRGKVVVEGVNKVKRHLKTAPERPGGIVEMDAPIAACKVMIVDPSTGKATRVHTEVRDGKKVRVAKSGAVIASQE
jgi:large subunit ribosomal protein L24